MMTPLEKYEAVNQCETVEDLQAVILKFADETGQIQGRTRTFNAQRMAENVTAVVKVGLPANTLTREYGIRQQALYLAYYNN